MTTEEREKLCEPQGLAEAADLVESAALVGWEFGLSYKDGAWAARFSRGEVSVTESAPSLIRAVAEATIRANGYVITEQGKVREGWYECHVVKRESLS